MIGLAFGNRGPPRSAPRPPPVKEGNLYELKIEDVGKEGDGIARINGFVIFVPNTKVGEAVQVRVTRVLRKLAFAEVVRAGTGTAAKAPAAVVAAGVGETAREDVAADDSEKEAGNDEELDEPAEDDLEDAGVWHKEDEDQSA